MSTLQDEQYVRYPPKPDPVSIRSVPTSRACP